MAMKVRILILGAGFGGLELGTRLSEALGEEIDVTLVDQSDTFVFGYSKLDVMFGRTTLDAVRLPYRRFVKPGVRFVQETVTAIDPESRKVTTTSGTYRSDYLVVALGADYDLDATPGLAGANEFYTVGGAQRLRGMLPDFSKGHALVGVSAAPYKCPPAPSECALLLHDYLETRGVRRKCEITMVLPLPSPVPPSPETSKALVSAFAERNIRFMPSRKVSSIDPGRKVAMLDDGSELAYDLYLGVPKHRAPKVVEAAGMMAPDGWVPVNPQTLETRFPRVYAVGDLANTGTPKAGVFAECAAGAVASNVIAQIREKEPSARYAGAGSCYIEFGAGRIGRVDVDFFSGPKPTGTYHEPSVALRSEKEHFGSSRRARWFGM